MLKSYSRRSDILAEVKSIVTSKYVIQHLQHEIQDVFIDSIFSSRLSAVQFYAQLFRSDTKSVGYATIEVDASATSRQYNRG